MPSSKDFKRLVRTRMEKTGESYTAARRQLLAIPTRSPEQLAAIAGMSNSAVSAKTGQSWPEWVARLTSEGADRLDHKTLAQHLRENHGLSGWWAQTVAIGYERVQGTRVVGQASDGQFKATKSKTFPVPVEHLYQAFSAKRLRSRWLADIDVTIRTARVNRSVRMTWPDGTSVNAWFTAKTPEKSQVSIQHEKLADAEDIARRKTFWSDRLAALAAML